MNWIKWSARRGKLSTELRQSLAEQTRWLAASLEYHLLGNHLLANAKALIFAGAFFGGAEGDEWLQTGLKILREQLAEQILPDGGHFELSPMYHAIVLNDLLDVQNVGRSVEKWQMTAPLPDPHHGEGRGEGLHFFYCLGSEAAFCETITKMRRWLAAMCHGDGEIAFFNDATLGQAPTPCAIEEYAARLKLASLELPRDGITHLANSGFVRWQSGETVFIADVGRIGPDYLPGHAHADTLSFELSVNGERVVVNSGISCYGISAERERQRGTAAHNTVVVNGENSSETWSGFRVARRAEPHAIAIEKRGENGMVLRAAHTGYQRLAGRVTHHREWLIEPDMLIVRDRLSGQYDAAFAAWHFGPMWQLSTNNESQATTLKHNKSATEFQFETSGELQIAPSSYHPGFGLSLPNAGLAIHWPRAMAQGQEKQLTIEQTLRW